MDRTISFLEETKQKIYDYIKQEDNEYLEANSRKLDLYCRKKTENPWSKCFYYRNIDMIISNVESLQNTSLLDDFISNRRRLTEEEMLFFKNSMIREAHTRKLPNLSSKPDKLRLLYGKYNEELKKYSVESDSLYEDASNSMAHLEDSANCLCLEAVKTSSEISITADFTKEEAVDSIAKMKNVIQDLLKFGDSAIKSVYEAYESIEKIRELDEKRDDKSFELTAHFLPDFLHPKVKKRKYSSPDWLNSWKMDDLEEIRRRVKPKRRRTANLPIQISKRGSLL